MDQSGTFWYHAHQKAQYGDGLRAPLIIREQGKSSGEFDTERILTVSEWYHEQMPSLIQQYLSVERNPMSFEPLPDSIIINDVPQAEFNMLPGQRTLFHIISMAVYANIYLTFQGHDFTIVEVDGIATEPMQATMLHLSSGQRYGIIITGKSKSTQNYAIMACLDPEIFGDDAPITNANTTGQLIYNREKRDPLSPPTLHSFDTIDDMTLIPLDKESIFQPVDRNIRLDLNFSSINGSNR